jgi:hypothetical protein
MHQMTVIVPSEREGAKNREALISLEEKTRAFQERHLGRSHAQTGKRGNETKAKCNNSDSRGPTRCAFGTGQAASALG